MSSLLLGLFTSSAILVFIGLIFVLRLKMPPSRGWLKVYLGASMIIFGRLISLWASLSGSHIPSVLNTSNRIVLEGAIGYLGGIIFVLAGFREIAPDVFRLFKKGGGNIRDELLYRAANSLIYPGCDVKPSIRSMLGYICKNYKLRAVSIHLISPRGGTLEYYVGKSMDVPESWLTKEFPLRDSIPGRAFLERKVIRSEPMGKLTRAHSGKTNSHKIRYVEVPIITGIKNWGVVNLIVMAEYRETESLEKFMKYFAERVGLCLDYEKADRENRAKSRFLNIHLSLVDIFNRWPDLNSSLPKIAEQIRKHLEFDQLFLARLDDSGENMWRYVYSNSGRSLVEKSASTRLDQSLLGRIVRSRKPEIFKKESVENGEKKDGIEFLNTSCIGAPLFKNRQMVGAMLLAASENSQYGINDLNILRFLSPVIAEYISHFNLQERIRHRESQLSLLAKGFGATTNDEELKTVMADTARILTRHLPVTSCRIMLLDNSGKEFRTIGIHQLRGLDWDPNSMSGIKTSAAPGHFSVTRDARPLSVRFDQHLHAIGEKERKLLFYSEIGSATIIPITAAGENLGVVSLGEMRNKKRRALDTQDMDFALGVCSNVGILLNSYLLRRKISVFENQKAGAEIQMPISSPSEWNKYHNEVMNALATIMGGCELISSVEAGSSDPLICKYLDVINHNSERIRSLTMGLNRGTADSITTKDRIRKVQQVEELAIR